MTTPDAKKVLSLLKEDRKNLKVKSDLKTNIHLLLYANYCIGRKLNPDSTKLYIKNMYYKSSVDKDESRYYITIFKKIYGHELFDSSKNQIDKMFY